MGQGLRPLPVLQNWDCHACGTCCKEYLVTLSPSERKVIEDQKWDNVNELGGYSPFRFSGWPWARRAHLNHRPDGSCVFLDPKGLCLIHKKHGYDTKPLPCRLFPWVLIPSGNRWQVGMRYACPSASENRGRPMAMHTPHLEAFALELEGREGLQIEDGAELTEAPSIQGEGRPSWLRFRSSVDQLAGFLKAFPNDIGAAMRAGLHWTSHLRETNLAPLDDSSFQELTNLFADLARGEITTANPAPKTPSWIARLLFRQLAALYTRKDHGPKRGIARQGPITRLNAIMRFSWGTGDIPRLHSWMPHNTFELGELPGSPLSETEQRDLHRYYMLKIISGQFCGRANHGLSLLDGFESLAMTLPVLLWIRRLALPSESHQTLIRALSIVDDHFGYNKMLGTAVYRLMHRILGGRGEIDRLIRWYGRTSQ